ncbi:MAG: ABC-2 transporter permease [Erysipelotrichaceae bacterium]|nr:ABC-2 transporter permease [Erysipelotrichaceae bacterium]
MKGLLIKDALLILRNKRSFTTLMLVCLIFGFSMGDNVPFVLCYTATVFGVLALGTVSYDEFDNGYPFLMSLPFERKTYAVEKYVFSLLFELAGLLVGLLVCVLAAAVRGFAIEPLETALFALVSFPLLIMIMSMLIFVQLKYGPERSRLVMFLFYGIILAGMAIVSRFKDRFDFSGMIENISPAAAAIGLLAVMVVVVVLMCRLSIRAVEKKEY